MLRSSLFLSTFRTTATTSIDDLGATSGEFDRWRIFSGDDCCAGSWRRIVRLWVAWCEMIWRRVEIVEQGLRDDEWAGGAEDSGVRTRSTFSTTTTTTAESSRSSRAQTSRAEDRERRSWRMENHSHFGPLRMVACLSMVFDAQACEWRIENGGEQDFRHAGLRVENRE